MLRFQITPDILFLDILGDAINEAIRTTKNRRNRVHNAF